MSRTKNKRETVLAILDEMPRGTTAAQLAAECMKRGVWPEDENDTALLRVRTAEVRDICNATLPDGLPAALLLKTTIERDEDGEIAEVHVVEQRRFWTANSVWRSAKQRKTAIRDDARKVLALLDHGKERWPKAKDWDSEREDLLPFA